VEIAPGLHRWSAPHPDWSPQAPPGSSDDWDRIVGCVAFELADTFVLIDPLLPAEERESFLEWLDERVAGRAVSVLTTIHWHRRDRELIAERYAENSSRAWNGVPAGVQPKPIRGAGETMFWLPGPAALVPGDRLIGDGEGGAQVCPESWLSRVRVDRAGLAHQLSHLLELPIERLLVSHGEPVLHDGRAALARALAAAAQS
jgi:hypothetical protein